MCYVIAALAALTLVLTGCSTSTTAAPSQPAPATSTARSTPTPTAKVVPPCPSEDYDGPVTCLWDAKARGNGLGHSFIWNGTEAIPTS
ncbi:hypothetical protein SEA_MUFASA8_57 [Arthrobacter phage Mufasa8]|uniref:Uncharacterized protein n=1 Tax=Arthrobacter phage Mufasa8 TaxID=2656526 RepID=A0A649VN54_9CAUD|nr:hypothetical protein HYQ08_gp057 [Arthrobacter phage Mufasa8]QGJ93505.1 hypothetical protein SEA_MUFASA8_57 [Arthrobacter phage Mufasa8]